jgi:hypothetical protein
MEPKSKKYVVLVCGLIPELLVEHISAVHAAAIAAPRGQTLATPTSSHPSGIETPHPTNPESGEIVKAVSALNAPMVNRVAAAMDRASMIHAQAALDDGRVLS